MFFLSEKKFEKYVSDELSRRYNMLLDRFEATIARKVTEYNRDILQTMFNDWAEDRLKNLTKFIFDETIKSIFDKFEKRLSEISSFSNTEEFIDEILRRINNK